MTGGGRHDIAVIGAGIVGVCCALWLARDKHRVVLVDGGEPGDATAAGSACTVATHACLPVNHPGLIGRLPLLVGGGALRVDPLYAVRHLPWFAAFVKHCAAGKVKKISRALGALLAHTYDGLTPLVTMANCERLLHNRGCLYAYRTERDFVRDKENLRARREHGVRYRELDGGEVHELEPNLKMQFARGVLFEDASHIPDPRALVKAFLECFRRHGGEWRRQNADAVRDTGDGVQVQLADGTALSAKQAVIAAGAFSRGIAGGGVESLPLGVERGCHVQFNGRHLLNRPLHWVGSGFYATPAGGGLRFAGTVELAGLSPRINPKTIRYLTRTGGRLFDLPAADQTWLGYRPTFPDSLPVIGESPHSKNILLAAGHQHIGLTTAGITGKLIAQLVAGAPTTVDLAPFSAGRFASRN